LFLGKNGKKSKWLNYQGIAATIAHSAAKIKTSCISKATGCKGKVFRMSLFGCLFLYFFLSLKKIFFIGA
jgi:hypothetical protein